MSASAAPPRYWEGFDDLRGRAPVPDGDVRRERSRLDCVWADGVNLALDDAGIVDGLFDREGLVIIFGPSGSGKTFLVVDLAAHIAAGRTWFGKEVEQGVVVYVAAEAPSSVERRFVAWRREHAADGSSDGLPVLIVRTAVDLMRPAAEVEKLGAEVRAEAAGRGEVRLVVVDTLARSMPGGDENGTRDMGAVVENLARFGRALNAVVAVVHHTGKEPARGARGSSVLKAAADVEIEVGEGAFTVTKHRDEAAGTSFGFGLKTVDLGWNRKGRTVTTCVVTPAEAPDKGVTKKRSLGGNQKIVMEALQAAICDHGEDAPAATDIPPKVKGVAIEQWQKMAARYLPQPEEKRKTEAFDRALSALVSGGLVGHVDGFVWPK